MNQWLKKKARQGRNILKNLLYLWNKANRMRKQLRLRALPNLSSKKSRFPRRKPNKRRLRRLRKTRMKIRMIMVHKTTSRLLRMTTKMFENSLVVAFQESEKKIYIIKQRGHIISSLNLFKGV